MAQTDEGPVFGRRESYSILKLEPPTARVELLADYLRDKVDAPGQTTRSESTLLRETLTLGTTGFIVHPNLVDLSLSGTGGLSQNWFNSNATNNERTNSFIYGFDLRATILRKEVAPLTLYAQRQETQLNRDFGPTLTDRTTIYGAIWQINSLTLPTRIQASHSEQEQEDPFEQQGFTQTQNTVQWETEWKIGANHSLGWNYLFNDVTQEAQTGVSAGFQTHEASLTHYIGFGTDARHTLVSTVSYLTQTGSFELERLRWMENLQLRHSPSFDTFGTFDFTRQESEFLEQTQAKGEAGFHHRLYKSLVTTGRAGVERLEAGQDYTTTDYYGNLTLDYIKKVPYGTLTSALGLAYDVRKNESGGGIIQIFDTPAAFDDPRPLVIQGVNVLPDTIVITDSTGLRVFSPLADYTVIRLPTRVEIRRVPGGAIAPGQAVLLDYSLSALPSNTTTTQAITIGGRYSIEEGSLRGLSVYARYLIQDQSIDTEVPSAFIPEDVRDLLLGVEYRFWAVVLSAEWEQRDSEFSPSESWRFNARMAQRIFPQTTLTLTATYETIDYPDDGNQVRFMQLSGTIQQQIGNNLQAVLSATWRDERNDLFGDLRGFEQQLEVNWRYRQTYIFLRLRNAVLDTEADERTFQIVSFGIRRDL